ncbi:MAG TPA: hypothetical protein VEG65_06690 [Candidatus Bathyarchaeia archaeon]|nr:hypothetical protein [Candidatus Bathyarchaeia archaeon]
MINKSLVLVLVLLVGCSAFFSPVVLGATSTTPTTVSNATSTASATAISQSAPTISPTAPAASDAAPKPQLDYRVSLAPNQIWDGTLEYFKGQGFTSVVLVAAEPVPYDKELQKIKQLGMYPILDIEAVIWNGGTNKSTPISQYDQAFSMWKQAGWNNVATEGGRSGDFDALKDYFAKITYFNCDKCGLYQDGYRNQYVTEMSWETYYPSEISSIQQGALISYNLGKPQGITAGVWSVNNENLNYETFKSLLDWSYSEGVGFTHFNVFFGLGATIADYQSVGFPAIISQLQQAYPPTPPGAWPAITVTSVRQVPNPQNSLVWDIANLGDKDAWVAPYAILHNASTALPGRISGEAVLSQDPSTSSAATIQQNDDYGWVHLGAGQEISVLSPPTLPADIQGAAYNAYVYYNNSSRGWLYDTPLYTTVGAKPIPSNFLGLFDYSNTDVALLLALASAVALTIVLVPMFRRIRQR